MAGRDTATGLGATPSAEALSAGAVVDPRSVNNIGAIRLALASLVIVSHASSFIYGDGRMDPLRVFRTVSAGSAAVDMFFLLSGWLITESWLSSQSNRAYLTKRLLRIAPAFVIAWMLSVMIGGALGEMSTDTPVWGLFFFATPPHMANGTATNGSMWTIAYEFRCYLLVMLLSFVPARLAGRLILAVAIIAIAGFSMIVALTWRGQLPAVELPFKSNIILGHPWQSVRFLACFSIGALAFLNRNMLEERVTGYAALACAMISLACLAFQLLAEPALITFGGIGLYWLAFKANIGSLQRINARADISYGTYLYGYPVQLVISTTHPHYSWLAQVSLALVTSWALGWVSWKSIEEPALHWKQAAIGRRAKPHPCAGYSGTC